MFSVALSVTLARTFLLRSMVLCAVPTFLAPAFPARDSPSHRRGKNTIFFRSQKLEERRKKYFCSIILLQHEENIPFFTPFALL